METVASRSLLKVDDHHGAFRLPPVVLAGTFEPKGSQGRNDLCEHGLHFFTEL